MPGFQPLGAAPAGEIIASGSYGDNLTWELDDSGVLAISGTGEMEAYNWSGQDFHAYAGEIQTVLVAEGVTSIGNEVFCQFVTIQSRSLKEPELCKK